MVWPIFSSSVGSARARTARERGAAQRALDPKGQGSGDERAGVSTGEAQLAELDQAGRDAIGPCTEAASHFQGFPGERSGVEGDREELADLREQGPRPVKRDALQPRLKPAAQSQALQHPCPAPSCQERRSLGLGRDLRNGAPPVAGILLERPLDDLCEIVQIPTEKGGKPGEGLATLQATVSLNREGRECCAIGASDICSLVTAPFLRLCAAVTTTRLWQLAFQKLSSIPLDLRRLVPYRRD